VQECYLRAFRYFDTFSGSAIKPWQWLCRVQA